MLCPSLTPTLTTSKVPKASYDTIQRGIDVEQDEATLMKQIMWLRKGNGKGNGKRERERGLFDPCRAPIISPAAKVAT